MITDAAIRKALRDGKFKRLADPSPRGSGRLLAVISPPLVEWYAQRIVDGKRRLKKLGSWPELSIAEARVRFADHKAKPEVTRDATLGAMFDGYVASLRAAGKPTADQIERILELAGAEIGRSRLARDVTPRDVSEAIRPIFERGARVQADKHRLYIGAAFRWGMKATHDYRTDHPMNWGIVANPVDSVPRDTHAEGVGDRWLTADELVELLAWARAGRSLSRKAIALIALTGQRVREITELRAEQWNRKERLLVWAKTKNGQPHAIPVCREAAEILDSLRPGPGGWLFPGAGVDGGPMRDAAVLKAVGKYAAWQQMPSFTGRDLRRTWKTLAGEAGLTKQERDWLQNHSAGDVSSRHYDRWENLPEKRAAVARWETWLSEKARSLRGTRRRPVVSGTSRKSVRPMQSTSNY